MRGICPGRIKELLREIPGLNAAGVRKRLHQRGLMVEGRQYRKLVREMIELTGSVDESFAEALALWEDAASQRAKGTLHDAAETNRGPRRDRQPRGTKVFFKADGRPTVIGAAAVETIRRRTSEATSGSAAQSTDASPRLTQQQVTGDGIGVQGRPEHQRLQAQLARLGQLLGYFVRSNRHIGANFRPDVLWYRLDPDGASAESHPPGAHVVFEIEFGKSAAIAKSLASLKHAYDLWRSNLVLLVPERKIATVHARLGGMADGAFHEIKPQLKVHAVETLPSDVFEFAKQLGLR